MLQLIRDKAQGWIAWVIVLLICVPFALWGVQEYLGPDPNVTVMTINGQDVGLQEYSVANQRLRMNYRDILNDDPTLNDKIRTQTVDRIVHDALLAQIGIVQGLAISDEQLALAIQGEQAFQINGTFSQSAYQSALANQGYSPGSFEAEFRRSLVSNQIATGLSESAFASDVAVANSARLELESRSFSVLRLEPSKFLDVEVSDADAKAYYDANKADFRSQEQLKLAFVKLSREDLAANVRTDDDELRSIFESRKEAYRTPPERRASHILIQVDADADDDAVAAAKAKADDASRRLADGEDFAAVAKSMSDDPGSAEQGGDLGSFGRGVMAPAFEAAAFEQEMGVVGPQVRTAFGFHIIRVDAVTGGELPTFEKAKPDVLAEYRQTEAEKIFYEQAERLSNLVYEQPDNLDVAAETLDLKIEETPWFGVAGIAGDDLLGRSEVLRAAFGDAVLTEGTNSEAIEIPGGVIVIRKIEHRPQAERSFDEVREDVVSVVRLAQAAKSARSIGLELVKGLRGGVSVDEAAAKGRGEWVTHDGRNHRDTTIPEDVRTLAFAMPRPDEGSSHYDGADADLGGFVIVALRKTKEQTEVSKTINNLLSAALQRDSGQTDFLDMVQWLRDAADITILEDRL
jgi:peptidyl-prolyl cis-trans isomerase D